MNKLASLLTIVLATACSGGGSGTDTPDDTGADAGTIEEEDTTSPSVLSISPAEGESGVRKDASVIIKFSEAMDQLSVQNSIASADLGAVSFEWSEGGSTLEIRPVNELEYAEGTGSDPILTPAITYTLVLGTGARDEAGNAIVAGTQTVFTTLKSISLTLQRDNTQTAAGTPEGVITDADDFLTIGDDGASGLSKARRGYVTIDMSALPDTTVEIVSALLKGQQLGEAGNPYGALGNGSGVILEHSIFAIGKGGNENAAFNLSPLAVIGEFSQEDQVELSKIVTAQVQDDLDNRVERADRSQYRLRFDEFTNLDDIADVAILSRDQLRMDVVYLAP